MARRKHRYGLTLTLALGAFSPGVGHADDKDLAPYKMLRSLQFVQDSVVLGDHSAEEMQRFMLSTIDDRLRSADRSVFDDVRNVDAALVYTMSGGNPDTLEFLMARDVDGHFDNRVADVLRKYLSGKGLLIVKTLADTAKEYRDKKIGPYLSLVAANVMSAKDPKAALKLYDWARLTSPGRLSKRRPSGARWLCRPRQRWFRKASPTRNSTPAASCIRPMPASLPISS